MVMAKAKKGMVSIFLVVFSTILLSLITIGFIRIMLDDQKRAINSDLADSARDSALAGVADAKRALLYYNKEICKNSTDNSKCSEILNKYLQANSCDAVQGVYGKSTGVETKIKATSGADSDLDQAYTCVKIKYFTDNYERDLDSGEQALIPLDLNQKTEEIYLSWGGVNKDGDAVSDIQDNGDGSKWRSLNEYGNQPPVLMVQHIRFGEGPSTLYLRPNDQGVKEIGFGHDSDDKKRGDDSSIPGVNVQCKESSTRPCKIKLRFASKVDANSKTDFLRIIKIYGDKAAFKLDFGDPTTASSLTRFNGIQPEIDSTGRANYVFRRLKARVEFTDGLFPYPRATLNVEGNICKDFEITNQKIKMNTECDVEATH